MMVCRYAVRPPHRDSVTYRWLHPKSLEAESRMGEAPQNRRLDRSYCSDDDHSMILSFNNLTA
jgi:hypothetical protein